MICKCGKPAYIGMKYCSAECSPYGAAYSSPRSKTHAEKVIDHFLDKKPSQVTVRKRTRYKVDRSHFDKTMFALEEKIANYQLDIRNLNKEITQLKHRDKVVEERAAKLKTFIFNFGRSVEKMLKDLGEI